MDSLGYLGSNDHHVIKFTFDGPNRGNTLCLVPDWAKADYEAVEREIREMNREEVLQDKSEPE